MSWTANSFDWTDERVRDLKRMFADGDSAGTISERFGLSRGAVSGKLDRLGIMRGKKPKKPAPARKPPRLTVRPPTRPAPEPPMQHVDDQAIPIEQRKQLAELAHGDCRWPVGDPGTAGFFFCAGAAVEDGPYCPAHHRRAFAGRPPRVSNYVRWGTRAA